MRIDDGDVSRRIECFCTRHALLAVAGRDAKSRKPFVWILKTKNGRVEVEAVVVSGEVHLTCRECLRVHKVVVHPAGPKVFDRQEIQKEIFPNVE